MGTTIQINDTICSCAAKAALDLNASLIIALTAKGKTAYTISRYRVAPLVLAVTDNSETGKYCELGYGIKVLIIKNMKDLKSDEIVKMYFFFLRAK